MMMKYLFLSLPLLFTHCTKSVDDAGLEKNRAKWESYTINSYEYTIKLTCFCVTERVAPRLIVVQQDKIVSVDGKPYDPNTTGPYPTIDELFDFISTSLAKKPYFQTLEFNATYGYPEKVFFDFSAQMADEEIGYQILDFKKL